MTEIFIEHNLGEFQRALSVLPSNVTQRVMKQIAQQAERETLRRYRRTTSTWHHQPEFTAIREATPTSLSVLVGTDSEVYGYVDKGTRAHEIVPRRPGYLLRFRSRYQAKTSPGVLGSGAGGASGDWVRAMRVWHPGTKARGFTPMIFREIGALIYQKTVDLLTKEIRRYMRVWGGRAR